jgi:hypothetical protein
MATCRPLVPIFRRYCEAQRACTVLCKLSENFISVRPRVWAVLGLLIQSEDRVKGTKRTSMAERVRVSLAVIFSTTVSC